MGKLASTKNGIYIDTSIFETHVWYNNRHFTFYILYDKYSQYFWYKTIFWRNDELVSIWESPIEAWGSRIWIVIGQYRLHHFRTNDSICVGMVRERERDTERDTERDMEQERVRVREKVRTLQLPRSHWHRQPYIWRFEFVHRVEPLCRFLWRRPHHLIPYARNWDSLEHHSRGIRNCRAFQAKMKYHVTLLYFMKFSCIRRLMLILI